MSNYISAGFILSKILGVTILVAAAVLVLILVLIFGFAAIDSAIKTVKREREKIRKEQELKDAMNKLAAAGVFMDIFKKQEEKKND